MTSKKNIRALKSNLRKASREAVKSDVAKLRNHIDNNRWVAASNVYTKTYTIKPYNVFERYPILKQKQIKDYIAASIFTHCADGWSLLGRALAAATKGDSSSAIHLAYYAELRAAMSLLAAEGVGVFNQQHVIITNSTADLMPHKICPRTHAFTWQALEHWADRKLSSTILSEIISPNSKPLSTWFDAFNIRSSLQPIGGHWLKLWGIDIKQFGEDQWLRNHSSYRPSRIVPRLNIQAIDSVSFTKELWHMFEPNAASRFDEIDKHLLRNSLATAYVSIGNPNPRIPSGVSSYKTWIKKHIHNLGFDSAIENIDRVECFVPSSM